CCANERLAHPGQHEEDTPIGWMEQKKTDALGFLSFSLLGRESRQHDMHALRRLEMRPADISRKPADCIDPGAGRIHDLASTNHNLMSADPVDSLDRLNAAAADLEADRVNVIGNARALLGRSASHF